MVDAADRAIEREALRIIRARREAERLGLTDDERAVLRIMERDLRRALTEQEEHLALEQTRSLGMATTPSLTSRTARRSYREAPATLEMTIGLV